MKSLHLLVALVIFAIQVAQAAPKTLDVGEDPRPFTHAPEAGGIKTGLESEDSELTPDTTFNVHFPSAMVPPDRIDVLKADSPVVAWPALDAEFVWRTQSQGTWSVLGPLIPAQTYHFHLREGLKSLDGTALPTDEWGLELETDPLTVSSDYDTRENLSSRPQVPLDFNYKVSLESVENGIWFQDRATRQRFPVEVLLNAAVSEVTADVIDATSGPLPETKEFRVRPRDPLPVGHFYDLIVDDVRDAYAGRGLLYPQVFALGATRPLAVRYVAARNWPGEKPYIEVKFNAPLNDDPLSSNAVTVDPAIPNLSLRKEGEFIYVDGSFDATKRYKVTIAPDIVGDRGYPLAKGELWGATFRPKPSARSLRPCSSRSVSSASAPPSVSVSLSSRRTRDRSLGSSPASRSIGSMPPPKPAETVRSCRRCLMSSSSP